MAALAACALLAAVLAWQAARAPLDPAPVAPAPAPAPLAATFVGSGECRSCHANEYAAWTPSQHARAMQHASEATVLGDFSDARFSFDRVTSTFFRRDGRYFVRTDGPDGTLADFEVKYTFGVAPLQQYLVEFPGGRLQALAVSWDTRPKDQGGQRWFRQYPNEKIDSRDELHWTKRAQNWNFMCADCHSTDVAKGYDAASDSYRTTWKEIAVGCESCHGPGSSHIAWARTRSADADKGLTVALDERRGVTWSMDPTTGTAQRSRERLSERESDVCAQCHARRAQVAEGYRAGGRFLDHYVPSLLTAPLYHADGQQLDEVYIWGSWLQSRMNQAGVTCSDCHDPHSQKLRGDGNAVCGTCHAAGKYDAPSHHRHAVGSAGAQCADCHMPRTTYMVVDPRRDHSMRVPRPDQSVALGVPNACNGCHTRQDAQWAAAAVRGWLGRDARGTQAFAPTFHAADARQAGAAGALAGLVNDGTQPPIVRASAIERLASLGAADAETVRRAVRDAHPLVRLAAVRLADALPPDEVARLAPLLGDPLRAVRIEAAHALAGREGTLSPLVRDAWQRAADEYVASLQYTADRPESRAALGSFHARRGRFDAAQAAFAQALVLDPQFVPAYLNAADALRAAGREGESKVMLRTGLARAPADASLHHALGLALVRSGQRAEALRELERAVRLAPAEPRYTFVLAVALHSTGRPTEAIKLLERAAARWPGDRDILIALATMQRDAGQSEAARHTAVKAMQAFPNDRDVAALAQQLR
jgi:Flp pilus assembly protein TadD/formate-dependent nitrite reductase cytochrome c552 subunit